MTATYTIRNRLTKQGDGDNVGTWDDVLNNVLDLIDEMSDGVIAINVSGTVTLSSVNGAVDQSRNKVLRFTGSGGTVIIPGVEKNYIIHNVSAGIVLVKTAAGAAASIGPGQLTFVLCDGGDCYGATYTGSSEFATKIVGPLATTARASFRAPPGNSPTTPENGDFWVHATDGLKYRLGDLTLGPGIDLLQSGYADFATTLEFQFVGNYRAYEIIINNFTPNTNGVVAALQISLNGGGLWRGGASDYQYAYHVARSDGTQAVSGGLNSAIILSGPLLSSGNGGMIELLIDRPSAGALFRPIRTLSSYRNSSAQMETWRGAGEFIGSGAQITNVRFFMSSNAFYGYFALYGRR